MTHGFLRRIVRAVDQEDDISAGEPGILSEEDLRTLLDESDRRKEAEIRRKGRIVSWVVCIPVLALLTWAGVFLATYRADEEPAVKVKAAPKTVTKSGKLVDQGDIDFALQLLNFSHASDTMPAKH